MKSVARLIPPLAAALGWFAVVFQFIIAKHALQGEISITEIVIRFFSYFTILTNIIVATYFTALTFSVNENSFWRRPSVAMDVTIYILVVGIIYNLILRLLWAPQGWARVVDEILHSAVPALGVVYWVVIAPKGKLVWKDCLQLLLYPLLYSTYVMIRGSFSNFYPYPFIDVNQLGYTAVFVNMVGILGLFLVLGLAFIAWDRRVTRQHSLEFSFDKTASGKTIFFKYLLPL